jgi:hypothetical protein
MAKMKEIGVVENNYHILQKNARTYLVEFRVGGHTISIVNFEWYERMSEETNAFSGDLVLDGINVGDCSNDGKGGCAMYHAFGKWELANEISQILKNTENYCFPSMTLSLEDVIDSIASLMVTFIANKVTTYTKAVLVINYLQTQADKYRSSSLERMKKIAEERAKEEQTKVVDTTPSVINKYGREWKHASEKYDVGNDADWLFFAEFAEGTQYMNKVLGIVLFIERNGNELETTI